MGHRHKPDYYPRGDHLMAKLSREELLRIAQLSALELEESEIEVGVKFGGLNSRGSSLLQSHFR